MPSPATPAAGDHFAPLKIPALLALGIAMLASNRWFTAVDDECAIIDRAATPLAATVRLFLSGHGQHEHPPLYDMLLHVWLTATQGNLHWVRVPATLFYLAGIWVIAATAKRIGGSGPEFWAAISAILWPYGFHFGRVAAWYSFCFLLVALETLLYVRYAEQRSRLNWILLFLSSVLLIYSNYFGWAVLALLAFDFLLVNRKKGMRAILPVLWMGTALVVSFSPIIAVFLWEIRKGVHAYHTPLSMILTGIYVLYAMFVSESVAPWFWPLGIPAAIAIALILLFTFVYSPAPAKRFLAYFLAALVAMTAIGVVETKRTMMLGPWLILPLGLALGRIEVRSVRRVIACATLLIFAIGWFGIFDRKLYAAPHWVEPWETVANQATSVIGQGGIVIGNNLSLFYYLTELLPRDDPSAPAKFKGLLPDTIRRRGVYTPEQWLKSGVNGDYPHARTVLLAKGLHYGMSSAPTDEAENWLNGHCTLTTNEKFAQDIGAGWKEKFVPKDNQLQWRVEIRTYACQ